MEQFAPLGRRRSRVVRRRHACRRPLCCKPMLRTVPPLARRSQLRPRSPIFREYPLVVSHRLEEVSVEVPLELTFRNVDKSSAIEQLIRKRVDKLSQLRRNVTRCRVAVEQPHQHATSGSPYRVRIDLVVPPDKELVVDEKPGKNALNETLQTIIGRAFDAAERQLKKATDRQRNHVKDHSTEQNLALVVRKFSDQGYGFIQSLDGQELYFHEHSVLHGDFSRLELGTMVRYESEVGDEGPQATSVQIVSKPGKRTTDGNVTEAWNGSSDRELEDHSTSRDNA